MAFLTIVIAYICERLFIQYQHYRQFDWLSGYVNWINDILSIRNLNHWVATVVLILPIVFVEQFIEGLFEDGLFGLLALVINVIVLLYCLGPLDLDQQVDDYIHSVQLQDDAMMMESAQAIDIDNNQTEFSLQIESVVESIFEQANIRLFACIFWFILMGAVGALLYRLIERLSQLPINEYFHEELKQRICLVKSAADWLPIRINVFFFMLAGHFEAAYSAFKYASNEYADIELSNRAIMRNAGRQAIQFQTVETLESGVDEIKKARGIVLRALMLWAVFALIISIF